MSDMKPFGLALADIFAPETTRNVQDSTGKLDLDLALLKKMTGDAASRNLSWRFLDAFTMEEPDRMLHWAFAAAFYLGWRGNPELMADVGKLIAQLSSKMA